MGRVGTFKNGFSFAERLRESRRLIQRHPNTVPVIVERYPDANLPDMERKKLAVPCYMTIGQFIFTLSERLKLDTTKALFVFIQDMLPQTASRMDLVYHTYKEEDGFLYICYTTEKSFG